MTQWMMLFVMHFVGDFVVQTDWQAKNKARNLDALLRHVVTYTVALSPWAFFVATGMPEPLYWLALNMVAHAATDAVTSQGTRYFSRADRVAFDTDSPPDWHNFFVVVGADQCIHYCTLVGLWFWLATDA